MLIQLLSYVQSIVRLSLLQNKIILGQKGIFARQTVSSKQLIVPFILRYIYREFIYLNTWNI